MTALVSCCPSCGHDLAALTDLSLGDLQIYFSGAVIVWKNERVSLSLPERLMLMTLVRAGGHPVKRWVLAEASGYEGDNADNNAAVHLHRMNRAFREIDPAFDMIENVRCVGVRWRTDA